MEMLKCPRMIKIAAGINFKSVKNLGKNLFDEA